MCVMPKETRIRLSQLKGGVCKKKPSALTPSGAICQYEKKTDRFCEHVGGPRRCSIIVFRAEPHGADPCWRRELGR